MRFVSPRLLVLAFAVASLTAAPVAAFAAAAGPLVSPIFGDHMVLQRGKPALLWGWAEPGARVVVSIAGQSAVGTAAADGRWQAEVALPPAGGPYEVVVQGAETRTLRDVLVGDVWLCGGQSNMNWALSASTGGADAAREANFPTLRFFTVGTRSAYAPDRAPQGEWVVCTPESAPKFSAVGFFFGRALQREIGVPVGLVRAALGGSTAECWMSAGSLEALGEFGPQIAEARKLHARVAPAYGSSLMHWLEDFDPGNKDAAWAQPAFDDAAWGRAELPGNFAAVSAAAHPVVVWFRREVTLPDPLPAGAAKLLLGEVHKMDTSYVNGRWVGASSWAENPRAHAIPADVLKPGRNTIAVRVLRAKADGGFRAKPENFVLELGDGKRVALAGTWRARLAVDAAPPHPLPLDWENYPTMPTVLFNGMLAPVAPLRISGALWYQGEGNFQRAVQYRKLLPALVADWRALFAQGDLPFYIASLPAFMQRRETPGDDGWTAIRDAQEATARTVPNTGLAVTVDTGDANNIHPPEKLAVGERLARCALAGHYGRAIAASGPTLRAATPEGAALRLTFDHLAGGLVVRGEKPAEFIVAGADRVWHRAEARVDGDTIVVSAAAVPQPVAVRYAWQANPVVTLFNAAGLPANSFRSDDWPLNP